MSNSLIDGLAVAVHSHQMTVC